MAHVVSWFEIMGKDGPALRSFYSRLFDWELSEAGGDTDYGMLAAGEGGIGGGIGTAPEGSPSYLTVYVDVDDVAGCLARAEQLGGTTVQPPTEVPGYDLTVALLADPEGHLIGLLKRTG
ncbi:MAG TPA: VOC family protein [Candidatus Dormibacteraeota bacterium]|nr:VOC family protein [Candidatus Dormibacteraeota bacterium]